MARSFSSPRCVVATVKGALADAGLSASDIAAIGITNQRETVVIWDRATGKPIHNAIVWQDRRTAAECERLRADGCESLVTERTGLLLDPYFSGTKLAWILDNVAGARERAERGELAFGTIDSFLLWRLTGGEVHATDITNAGRTLLLDIERGEWDDDLLQLLRIPASLLPTVCDNSQVFGYVDPGLFGARIPISGMAGERGPVSARGAAIVSGMSALTGGAGRSRRRGSC